MDHQTLERLLTQRAVGQLDDDAAELLAGYVGEHPELQESAESIEQTVQLAERAIQRCDSYELPPLDRYRINRSRRWSYRSKLLRQALAVTAAFVLGVSTVWIIRPAERPAPGTHDAATPGAESFVTYRSAQPIGGEDFWSLSVLPRLGNHAIPIRRDYPSREIRQSIEATF